MANILLFHGTDIDSALDILNNGLDAAIAASYNGGGEFWATVNLSNATHFAGSNPKSGRPAVFCFEISDQAIKVFSTGPSPKLVVHAPGQDFEFLRPSFQELNQIMVNPKVILLQ